MVVRKVWEEYKDLGFYKKTIVPSFCIKIGSGSADLADLAFYPLPFYSFSFLPFPITLMTGNLNCNAPQKQELCRFDSKCQGSGTSETVNSEQ